jgi:hypothetical protein
VKRTFWLGVGIASGVALSRKATKTARQATPAGLASNVGDAIRELAGAIGTFGAEVRAGMTEREQELHEEVERSTGVRTRYGVAAPRPGRHAREAQRPAARRAPKADV